MSVKKIEVLVCDEPKQTKGAGQACGHTAVATVELVVGGRRYTKDLCQRHVGIYVGNARPMRQKGKR